MKAPGSGKTVRLSLLDRLIDRKPKGRRDESMSWRDRCGLKASVRHDLEWLLNTRRIPDAGAGVVRGADRSLYHFGFPDITSMGRDSKECVPGSCGRSRRPSQAFEPRLAGVRVSLTESERRRQAAAAVSDRGAAAHGAESRAGGLRHGPRDLERRVPGQGETAVRDDLLSLLRARADVSPADGRGVRRSDIRRSPRGCSSSPTSARTPTSSGCSRASPFSPPASTSRSTTISRRSPRLPQRRLPALHPAAAVHVAGGVPARPRPGQADHRVPDPRDTLHVSAPVGGVPCKFKSCYDTTLWPLAVSAAQWQTPDRLSPPVKDARASAALRLEFRACPSVTFDKLELEYAAPPPQRRRATWSSPCTSCSATTASGSWSATRRPDPAEAGAAARRRAPPRRASASTRACCRIPGARSWPTGCCRSTSAFPRSSCSSTSPGSRSCGRRGSATGPSSSS